VTASPAQINLPRAYQDRELDIVIMFIGASHGGYEARIVLSQPDGEIANFTLRGTLARTPTVIREVLFISAISPPRAALRSAEAAPRVGPSVGDIAPLDAAAYVVFYGTNRRRADPGNISKGYSADRASSIDYGTCTVLVPKSHKIGSTGSPWWKRLITHADDRLRVIDIRHTSAEDHWRQMQERQAVLAKSDRDAVLFIHGYNVSFEQASLRAAQIGFDLSIKGPMAFFSWPSQGSLKGYLADAATIEASEGAITDYLSDFATRTAAERVHVIAHSMGNRGALRAVNRIAEKAHNQTGIPFSQFILAAADVDADTFRSLCSAYRRVARRTTLYVSERDRAVEASQWLHEFPRAGLAPPVFVAPGIDTINVTNADLTMLGHGYVAEARGVLQDMHDLIRHGAPPGDRFGMREALTPAGEKYWLISA
jgi:esterase/lipase superfamily enzyme